MSHYIVGGLGWEVSPGRFIPAGTVIDDSSDAYLASVGPPPDAAPLNFQTYYYMLSWGVVGKGYPYWMVSTRFLSAQPFVLGSSQLGRSDHVLG